MSAALLSCTKTLTKSPSFSFLLGRFYAVIHSQTVDIDSDTHSISLGLVGSCPGSQADHLFNEIAQRTRTPHDCSVPDVFRNQSGLEVFRRVVSLGLPLDGLTICSALRACGSLSELGFGKQVHCRCVKSGLLSDTSVSAPLIDMYVKDGELGDGRKLLDELVVRNVVLWTSMIAGYVRNGSKGEGMMCLRELLRSEVPPNAHTYSCLLGGSGSGSFAKMNDFQVHAMVIKSGHGVSIFVGNALIHTYVKVGMVRDAGRVFESMESKDDITWKGMFAGFVADGDYFGAVGMLRRMGKAGIVVGRAILAAVIKLCANIKDLSLVRQIHCQVVRKWMDSGDDFATGLLVAYGKCGKMDCALSVFSSAPGMHSVVSWTAVISGCVQNHDLARGINLFRRMIIAGVKPNDFTYSVILGAHPLIRPKEVHAQVIKTNYETLPTVGTALLDAYVRIGAIDVARVVFNMIDKDIVAWSAMLSGYAQIGDSEGAVRTYMQLGEEGISPNEYTYSSVINACTAPAAAAEQGKQLHACSIKWGYSRALCVSSALVTMYAKRGNIDSAYKVFCRQKERDLVSWNSMISGYAQHGHARKAFEVFDEMERRKIGPDGITFVGVISACTHAGMVEQGEKYYSMMVDHYQIAPTMEHYSCMVDLYSRAGMIEKATSFIASMPFQASATVWRSVLGGCRLNRNLEIGKLAAEKLISLQPDHSAAYTLLSNIYASAGKWKEKSEIRKLMDERKVKKEAGYSWIEVKNKTYTFLAGDSSHPLSDRVNEKLCELLSLLKDMGYQPDTDYVLHNVEEQYKEAILWRHSEKLALAFGLISTPQEVVIRIEKNLRVCGDCHTVFKLIAKIEQREVVVRDSNRFHHFKGGSCSCGDYW